MHAGDFPDVDVGMVSDGHGFEDSPDCERIAGGVNSKGPRAIAIGRQANLLQWGFYGAPDRMTVEARRAFLNAIVWMRQFRGERPLANKQTRSRTWWVQYIDQIEKSLPKHGPGVGNDDPAGPPRLPGDPVAVEAAHDELRAQWERQRQQEAARKQASYLLAKFPPELVADGIDVDRLRAWYAVNEEYFGPGADQWSCAVDADLAAICTSNRKPEFLHWLVGAFAVDAHDERALRLARRYLGEHGRDAATATAFIETNRDFLFFSDTAGFRWLVDENRRRRGR